MGIEEYDSSEHTKETSELSEVVSAQVHELDESVDLVTATNTSLHQHAALVPPPPPPTGPETLPVGDIITVEGDALPPYHTAEIDTTTGLISVLFGKARHVKYQIPISDPNISRARTISLDNKPYSLSVKNTGGVWSITSVSLRSLLGLRGNPSLSRSHTVQGGSVLPQVHMGKDMLAVQGGGIDEATLRLTGFQQVQMKVTGKSILFEAWIDENGNIVSSFNTIEDIDAVEIIPGSQLIQVVSLPEYNIAVSPYETASGAHPSGATTQLGLWFRSSNPVGAWQNIMPYTDVYKQPGGVQQQNIGLTLTPFLVDYSVRVETPNVSGGQEKVTINQIWNVDPKAKDSMGNDLGDAVEVEVITAGGQITPTIRIGGKNGATYRIGADDHLLVDPLTRDDGPPGSLKAVGVSVAGRIQDVYLAMGPDRRFVVTLDSSDVLSNEISGIKETVTQPGSGLRTLTTEHNTVQDRVNEKGDLSKTQIIIKGLDNDGEETDDMILVNDPALFPGLRSIGGPRKPGGLIVVEGIMSGSRGSGPYRVEIKNVGGVIQIRILDSISPIASAGVGLDDLVTPDKQALKENLILKDGVEIFAYDALTFDDTTEGYTDQFKVEQRSRLFMGQPIRQFDKTEISLMREDSPTFQPTQRDTGVDELMASVELESLDWKSITPTYGVDINRLPDDFDPNSNWITLGGVVSADLDLSVVEFFDGIDDELGWRVDFSLVPEFSEVKTRSLVAGEEGYDGFLTNSEQKKIKYLEFKGYRLKPKLTIPETSEYWKVKSDWEDVVDAGVDLVKEFGVGAAGVAGAILAGGKEITQAMIDALPDDIKQKIQEILDKITGTIPDKEEVDETQKFVDLEALKGLGMTFPLPGGKVSVTDNADALNSTTGDKLAYRYSGDYGPRALKQPNGIRYHKGLDMTGASKVVSALPGTIYKNTLSSNPDGGGMYIVHDDKVTVGGKDYFIATVYRHIIAQKSGVPRSVTQGEELGTVKASDNHLHFEVILFEEKPSSTNPNPPQPGFTYTMPEIPNVIQDKIPSVYTLDSSVKNDMKVTHNAINPVWFFDQGEVDPIEVTTVGSLPDDYKDQVEQDLGVDLDELNLTGPQLEKVGASLYAYDVMVPAMKASSSLNQDAVSRLDKNMLVAILGIETRYGQDTTNNVKDGPFQVGSGTAATLGDLAVAGLDTAQGPGKFLQENVSGVKADYTGNDSLRKVLTSTNPSAAYIALGVLYRKSLSINEAWTYDSDLATYKSPAKMMQVTDAANSLLARTNLKQPSKTQRSTFVNKLVTDTDLREKYEIAARYNANGNVINNENHKHFLVYALATSYLAYSLDLDNTGTVEPPDAEVKETFPPEEHKVGFRRLWDDIPVDAQSLYIKSFDGSIEYGTLAERIITKKVHPYIQDMTELKDNESWSKYNSFKSKYWLAVEKVGSNWKCYIKDLKGDVVLDITDSYESLRESGSWLYHGGTTVEAFEDQIINIDSCISPGFTFELNGNEYDANFVLRDPLGTGPESRKIYLGVE